MNKKKKVIVIMGPTAVGKTALGVQLAKQYNGEVINGDSLQVYRTLDIGTAKVTEEEMDGVVHHLIDIVDPAAPYTASDFKEAAEAAIEAIHQKGKLPIIVGGSGLYIQGLLSDLTFGNAGDDLLYRAHLEEELAETSAELMWNKLLAIDPKAAQAIHPNNSRRVIRALEAIHVSGQLFSDQELEVNDRYDSLLIALNCDRGLLYERINGRVDSMLEKGLLEEARFLYDLAERENNQAHKGIGYKEWFPYFDGQISFDDAKEAVKQNSRRYAKRQLTWFRNRMANVHWFDVFDQNYQLDVNQVVTHFIERGD